jgi:hypothetical protein
MLSKTVFGAEDEKVADKRGESSQAAANADHDEGKNGLGQCAMQLRSGVIKCKSDEQTPGQIHRESTKR